MDYNVKMHRVSVAVLQAGVRRIDADIKTANDRGDKQNLEKLLQRRHNVVHEIGRVVFPIARALAIVLLISAPAIAAPGYSYEQIESFRHTVKDIRDPRYPDITCRILLTYQPNQDGTFDLKPNPDKNYYLHGCCSSSCTTTEIKS